jgi:hypothetical protein
MYYASGKPEIFPPPSLHYCDSRPVCYYCLCCVPILGGSSLRIGIWRLVVSAYDVAGYQIPYLP